jgi:hypothetical protein
MSHCVTAANLSWAAGSVSGATRVPLCEEPRSDFLPSPLFLKWEASRDIFRIYGLWCKVSVISLFHFNLTNFDFVEYYLLIYSYYFCYFCTVSPCVVTKVFTDTDALWYAIVGTYFFCLWLYSPLDLGCFFSFLIVYTGGKASWTGDQPVARPLPTQTQNRRTHTCMPRVGFETTTPVFGRAKTVDASDRAATVITVGTIMEQWNNMINDMT